MPVEWKTIADLRPEIVLAATATAILVGGAFTRNRGWWTLAAVLGYLLSAAALAAEGWPWLAGELASGPISVDPLSLGLRWLGLAVGLAFTFVTARRAEPELTSEAIGCLMLVALGIMLTAVANELALLFLGLELISIPTYVLLFLGRRDRASGEATMKYFFLSILASALLLYGFSFLYGVGKTTLIAGTPAQPGIREALAAGGFSTGPLAALAPLALVLLVAGLGFKLAVAPLQFYAPDVYQGTTNANAGLLAVAPKIAGVAGLLRLVLVAMPPTAEFAWQLALVISLITMTLGNVCALWQRNVRRLMAYSSIAHGGYLLIGLAAASAALATGQPAASGAAAMCFYLLVYALASMGVFVALAYLSSARREVNDVEELAGLARAEPLVAAALAVCLLSLAGLPPLAGFWGKLQLFSSAVQLAVAPAGGGVPLWFMALAVIGALNAAIAAAYYLRIVGAMYFQPAVQPLAPAGGPAARIAALLLAAAVLAAGVLPGRLVETSRRAGQALVERDWLVPAEAAADTVRAQAAMGNERDAYASARLRPSQTSPAPSTATAIAVSSTPGGR